MVSRIYFDTNVLEAAGWPRPSAALENLLKLARTLKLHIFFPHVVKLELEKHWLRTFNQRYSSANSALKGLKRHLLDGTQIPIPELNSVDQAVIQAGYREFTAALEKKWNIETVPLTERLDELVEMAVNERAPFGEKGKGFQDAVIYLSVLDHLARTNETAVFLSNDGSFEKITDQRFEESGFTIYREVTEVVDFLAKAAKERKIIVWEERREAMKSGLKSRLKDIERFVSEELSVPDNIVDLIIDQGMGNLVVKAVSQVDILDVADVQIPLDETGHGQATMVSAVLRAKFHMIVGRRYTEIVDRTGSSNVITTIMRSPQILKVGSRAQTEGSSNLREDTGDAQMEISFEASITLEAKAILSAEAANIEFVSVNLTNPPRDRLSEFKVIDFGSERTKL